MDNTNEILRCEHSQNSHNLITAQDNSRTNLAKIPMIYKLNNTGADYSVSRRKIMRV